MTPYQLEINKAEKLLIIRYAGDVRQGDNEDRFAAVQRALAEFEPGFRLLVDLTQLKSMEPSCAAGVRRIMDLCNARGVSLVARIIPDPSRDIGLQIMSYFHYRPEVHTMTCRNPEEAEMILSA